LNITLDSFLEDFVMATTFPIAKELPADLLARVGHIIALWSYQEWLLRSITYALIGLDHKHGRVAIREPRCEEYITMWQQLVRLDPSKKLTIRKGLQRGLKEGERYRDLIAHSVWGVNPATGEFTVQQTSGTWKPSPRGPKISRKELPQGVQIKNKDLEAISNLIALTVQWTEETLNELEQQGASRDKPPSLSDSGNRAPDRKQNKPQSQRSASRQK
jgi:hypothetical protein